jgi:hypothetical protein
MRKLALLVAAVPLLFTPSALATDDHDGTGSKGRSGSVCRPPDIGVDYDLQTFTVAVSLPASGCKTREHTTFDVSVTITRVENEAAERDLAQRTMTCGPFPAADDFDHGAVHQYFCNLTVSLGHPDPENAEYAVDVSYPGAAAQRTVNLSRSCVSHGTTASCEK